MLETEKLSLLRAVREDVIPIESDELLSAYLSIAGRKILNKAYPYDESVTEVPVKYHHLQVEIASYLLDKRGAEGEVQHVENGISRTYESADVPKSMLSVIVPHVGTLK